MINFEKRLDALERNTPEMSINWRDGKTAEYIAKVEQVARGLSEMIEAGDVASLEGLIQTHGITGECADKLLKEARAHVRANENANRKAD